MSSQIQDEDFTPAEREGVKQYLRMVSRGVPGNVADHWLNLNKAQEINAILDEIEADRSAK